MESFKSTATAFPVKILSRVRGSPFAFPLAALAALAMFVISESSYQQASSTFERLGEQGGARTAIQQLWRSLTDAETGQRGYLLTNRPEYLAPYNEGVKQVAVALAILTNFYNDDPRAAALVQRMANASTAKLGELTETIKVHDSGSEAWRDMILSNIGKEQMDAVRITSAQLLEFEGARVAINRASVTQTLLLNRIGVSAMTALSLLALFMYLRQTSALIVQREEQRRLVQAERDLLEIEVARRTDQLTDLAATCRRCARTNACAWRVNCTTSSARCSRRPSSTWHASSRAWACSRPKSPSACSI